MTESTEFEARPPTRGNLSKFDQDLYAGHSWERHFLNLLNGKVECKLDRLARTTSNLFIEYECRGHPSGLAVTEAGWWAIGIVGPDGDVETAVLVSVPWLKAVCGRLYRAGRIVSGGDDGASRGVLLPIGAVVGG